MKTEETSSSSGYIRWKLFWRSGDKISLVSYLFPNFQTNNDNNKSLK